jgi:hypothetical protein
MTKSDSITPGKPLGASLNNPLSEIINLIPWTSAVVTAELLDSIALTLKTAKPRPTQHVNQYTIKLLHYLHDINYVSLNRVKLEDVEGEFYIIKRI